jgi:DNA-binding SARP family transcriptional activator/tetratricopeptide (TPR) repeat protein
MEFRTLGPFEARHDGVQVDLGDLQQRFALVVLLLHCNRPISTDRLINTVWPGSKPRTNLIPSYMARLRKSFKESGASDVAIETTPTGYVLRVNEEQLDSARFTRLYDEATTALRHGDKPRATEILREAVGLWRGRHFEDLDIDRIGGAEVILLDEVYIDAVGDLAELELEAGNHRYARDRLRPIVRTEPSRQRHAALLMRALLANDDHVEAVKVYHLTREALDEFGLETSAGLRNLAWLAQHGEPRNMLPPRPPRFTGRAEELGLLESVAAAAADEPRAVWLSGAPGVGKTGLAIEAAHRLGDRFADARLYIPLNGFTPNLEPTSAADALTQLLLKLGVPAEQLPPDDDRRKALYQSKLLGTRTLVVLDNAGSEDQVLPLLPEAPGCMAIVTSRRLGGVAASESIRLGPLPPTDAGELFRTLTGPTRSRGRSAQVVEVVDRCGRLPLQIKVAASQFRRHDRWPLDHLVQLLSETGSWTSDNEGAVAYLVSYRQLDGAQQALFRLFGHLPGQDIGVPGVAALAGCEVSRARRLLEALHESSLIEEFGPERYHMLDPLKEFAAREPGPAPDERAAALERLLDFYLVSVHSAIRTAFPFDGDHPPKVGSICSVAPNFTTRADALTWLTVERPNLVAAIRHASRNLPDHAWRLAVLLWRYFSTISELRDWLETLELAKGIVMADQANRYGQAHVLLRLAAAHRRLGQLTQAQELAAQALPRWLELGDVRGEADTLCALAMPKMELGQHDEAIVDFEAALAKYRQIDDLRGQANVLSHLGYLNELHGRLEEAQRQHLAAVPMLRAIEHRQALAHALDNLGTVQQRLGLLDEAMASHVEARSLAIDSGDRSVEAYALNNIGNVHRLRDQLDEALRYQEQARLVADAVGDAQLRSQLYLDRGATFHARGGQREALDAYLAALDLATGAGERTHLANAHRGIAKVLHGIGDHERAVEHWAAAEAEFELLGQPEAAEIRQERAALDCSCRLIEAPSTP